MKFTIYAYEFESGDVAKEYYKNHHGYIPQSDTTFHCSMSPTAYLRTVLDGENIYVIHSTIRYMDAIDTFFAEVFLHDIQSDDTDTVES